MSRWWSMLVALMIGACGPRPAVQTPATQVERTMAAFAAMDLDGFDAGLASDVGAFEMDLEGKPVRLGSRQEVDQFASGVFAAMKQMGATLKVDIHADVCRASGAMAYCTVEFDVDVAMPDGSAMVQPSRNTVVLRRDGDVWHWVHWHSSLSQAAPAP